MGHLGGTLLCAIKSIYTSALRTDPGFAFEDYSQTTMNRFFIQVFELQGGGKAIPPAMVYPFLLISILNSQRGGAQQQSFETENVGLGNEL